MSNNLVLGTVAAAAAVAGGAYIYEQNNQQKYTPRELNKEKLPTTGELSNKLSGTIEQTKQDLKSQGKYWADKAKETDLYKSTVEAKDAIELKYDALKTPLDQKSFLTRQVDHYIDFVNYLGGSATEAVTTTHKYTTVSPDVEVRDKPVRSWFQKDEDKVSKEFANLKQKTEAEGKSWSTWGSQKVGEAEKAVGDTVDRSKTEFNKQSANLKSTLAEKKDQLTSAVSRDGEKLKQEAEAEKKSWLNWGNKKSEEVDEYNRGLAQRLENSKENIDEKAARLKYETEKAKNSWFSWGSKKADEVEAKAQTKADSWSSWGDKKSSELQRSVEQGSRDLSKQLDQSKDQLSATFQEQKQNAIKTFESTSAELDRLTKDFLTSKDPQKQQKLDKAKQDASSAIANLKSYGDDVFHDINERIKSVINK